MGIGFIPPTANRQKPTAKSQKPKAKSQLRSVFPAEGTFFQGVDVGDEEDGDETEHAEEHGGDVSPGEEVFEGDRPWVQEHDLDVEDDEEHRDDVEFHAEARLGIADGEHATLVGAVFHAVALGAASDDDAGGEAAGGEADGDDDLQDDRDVLVEHLGWLSAAKL